MKALQRSPGEYPSIIVSSNNILEIVANCYVFCSLHQSDISNACRTNQDLDRLFTRLRRRFRRLIRRERTTREELLLNDTSKIQHLLLTDNMEELIVRGAALLKALALYAEHALARDDAPKNGHVIAQASEDLGGEKYYITPAAENPLLAQCRRLGRLGREEDAISETIRRYHWPLQIIPKKVDQFQIVRKHLNLRSYSLLEKRLRAGTLKIAAAPLNPDIKLEPDFPYEFPADQPKRFVLRSIANEQAQHDCMKKILRQCREQRISVLVLPELRMPPFLQELVKEELQSQSEEDLGDGVGLLLVVCGSWHVQEKGSYKNQSVILDHMGNEVWRHDKLAEYHITRENVADHPEIWIPFGLGPSGGVEGIRTGSSLEICDCPLGRIAVAICVGFFHRPLGELLVKSGATMFLVPTMSQDIRDIELRARALAPTQQATVVVANCAHVGGKKAPSFYQLPIRDEKRNRVRIREGEDLCVLKVHRPRNRKTSIKHELM